MEGVGWGLEEGVTHACNCAAVEYVKAVLASDGSVGGNADERGGAIARGICTVCSCRISSSKLTVPGRASVIRSW